MFEEHSPGSEIPEPLNQSEAQGLTKKYHGAKFVTPFDEARYDGCTIWVAVGDNKRSIDWKPGEVPLVKALQTLAHHQEGKKDGRALVFGRMDRGPRKKVAIQACTAIALDYDTGILSSQLDEALAKFGCLCLRYTSHSHWKTSTDISLSEVRKFGGTNCEITTELMQRYLNEEKHWEEWIVATVVFDGEHHTGAGYVCRVRHDPMPKHRVIVFLREPFVMRNVSDDHSKAMAMWGKVIAGASAKLGFKCDPACMDPSHLFYLARHDKDRPYEVSIFGGDLFDWRILEVGATSPFDAVAAALEKSGKKSKTEAGRKLARWAFKVADGFQIEEFISDHCSDRCRGSASSGITIECPNDAQHSNPGDSSDTACFAKNAGIDGNFVISCRHASCSGLTNLDMLGLMIAGWGLDRAALDDPQYDAVERGDAQPDQAMQADERIAQIEALIGEVPDLPSAPLVKPVVAEIAKLDDEYEEDRLLRLLSRKKVKVGFLHTMLAAEKRKGKKDEGKSLKYDDHGRAIFKYDGGYNEDDLVNAVRATLANKNVPHAGNKLTKPTPTLTAMLGIPMKLRERDGKACFDELKEGAFHAEVCESIMTVDVKAGGRKFVDKEISTICFHTAESYLTQAPELVRTPLFDASFNLICEPGWYQSPVGVPLAMRTSVFMSNDCLRVRKVSPEPSDGELKEAVNLIRNELLVDFPFCTFHDGVERREPAEANAIGMLLTPYVMRGIDGNTPLFFVSKPDPGTGGTLLGKLPMILDGVESVSIDLRKSPEEVAKAILAAIMSSQMCMFFDNVTDLNNPLLLQHLTARMIGGRLLGQTKIIERLNNFLWVATGNNPRILEEMNRRTVFINLNAKVPDVSKRKFKRKLETWAADNRGEIIWALLTMIQSWVSSGKKPFTTRTKLSFERWAEVVGGVLENAGIEGFLDIPERVASDQNQSAANELVRHWSQEHGCDELTIRQLAEFASRRTLDAWSGKSDEDRRIRFIELLDAIEFRTFDVDGKLFMVRKLLNSVGDLVFTLKTVDAKNGEAGNE